ncbi:MAG: periplasmic heavy metal sensor [Verrucomicrobiota bacterium JB022]|nr:periplasmic heavy metal sensor [Verrucomicrobiota bacterium JB022]
MNDSDTSRVGAVRLMVAALLLVAVCAGVSLLTVSWFGPKHTPWQHDEPHHGHAWLHQELGLSADEAARIDAFEADYRQERTELEAEFNRRIATLAQLLHDNDSYTPEVTAQVHRIHEVHGRLQELAIQHYYEMLSVLPPEKQARLRELAVEALSQPE